MVYVVPQTSARDAFNGVRSHLASVYREDDFWDDPDKGISLVVFDPEWDANMRKCQIKLQAEWRAGAAGVISMRNYNVNGGRDLIIVYPEPGAKITATREYIDINGHLYVPEEKTSKIRVKAGPSTVSRTVELARL